jgi:hypothetical protein
MGYAGAKLLTPVAETPLGPKPHANTYRPGVYQDVFFQLHDFFGTVVTDDSKGSGVLVKLNVDKQNTGMPGVAVSNNGIVAMKRMDVGGKLGVKSDWATTATWFRANYVPGDVIRLDTQVTIQATAEACMMGEKTVYSFDPYKLKQAANDGSVWSLSSPAKCAAAQRTTVPSTDKCTVKACVWCAAGSYAVDLGTTTCRDCQTARLAKYYSGTGKIWSSVPATVGADCSEGGAYIFPKSGYWRSFAPGDFIYKCPMSGACQGGRANRTPCTTGYTGPLCAVCNQDVDGDRYANAGKVCNKCGGFNLIGDAISLFIILLVVLSVVARVVYNNWCGGGDIKGTKALKIMMKKKKMAARTKAIVGQALTVSMSAGSPRCLAG